MITPGVPAHVLAPIQADDDEAQSPETVLKQPLVKRGYDVDGEFIRFFVKVENVSALAIHGVKVWLDYPDDKLDLEKPGKATQNIGALSPGEKKSVKYYLKPLACIETSIAGRVHYKDAQGKEQEIKITPKVIVNVCPLLKGVRISKKRFQKLWFSDDLVGTKKTKSYTVNLQTAIDVIKTSLANMTMVNEESTHGFWHASFAAKQKKANKHVLADIQVVGTDGEGRDKEDELDKGVDKDKRKYNDQEKVRGKSSVTIDVRTEDPDARAGFIRDILESIDLQIRNMESIR